MYEARVAMRRADPTLGTPPTNEAVERGLASLARVRTLLTDFVLGMAPDRQVLLQRLETPLPEPPAERERQAACGWLLWWAEQYREAGEQLQTAVAAALAAADKPTLAFAAYWLTRVRLRLREQALGCFESVLPNLSGWPQSLAYYVDLLWRAGRTDRAEQLWLKVRHNKRLADCPEGALLQARLHLRRCEWNAAEKYLNDHATKNGPMRAEVHLLRAWLWTATKKTAQAAEQLDLAQLCPYPAGALAAWREALASYPAVRLADLPEAWQTFLAAQQARSDGQQAVESYRKAAECAALAPMARYGLVMLGLESASELLPEISSPFWGIRLRAHAACERFARRESPASALLESLASAARAGYSAASLEHYQRLAQDDFRDAAGPEGPMRTNALLLLLEQGHPLPDSLPPQVEAERQRRRLYEALQAEDAEMARGLTHAAASFFGPDWRRLVDSCPSLLAALAVHAAAQRGDVTEAVQRFRALPSPPRFVVRAMQALWLHRPGDAELSALGLPLPPDAPPSWTLHRAARALVQRDYREALALLQGLDVGILPTLRQLAEAQRLAEAFPEAGLATERLLPLVRLLEQQGHTLGDSPRACLERIDQGPSELRHCLAVLFWRGLKADALDRAAAERAWRHWLACAAPAVVIEQLLGWHQQAIVTCLLRGVPEAARKHWELLHRLPELQERLVGFRDQLATQFLVQTREVLRHAEAPPGFAADYESGLTLLRRLLSLDRENTRLLAALVEICNDWFLDCYHAERWDLLRELVQRHRPFAEQLYRLVKDRPGEVMARNVLSDFWKARGFSESDPQVQATLYREALQLNPKNENVKQLLAELEGDADADADPQA